MHVSMYLYSVDLWMKLCALGDREEKSEREREREKEREKRNKRDPAGKKEKSRISSRRLFRGCDYRCLSDSRVSTRTSFSPRPSICLALQTWRSIIPRLRCNEISRAVSEYGGTYDDDADPGHCRVRPSSSRGSCVCVGNIYTWHIYIYIYVYIYVRMCTKHTARTGRGRVIIIRKASHSFWITQCVASTIVISADWQRKDTEKPA